MRRYSDRKSTVYLNACRKIAHAFSTTTYTCASDAATVTRFTNLMNAVIKKCSMYPDFQTAIDDFIQRWKTYKDDYTLNDKDKICKFLSHNCDIHLDAAVSLKTSTSSTNGFLATEDNDGILGKYGAYLLMGHGKTSITPNSGSNNSTYSGGLGTSNKIQTRSGTFRAIDCVPNETIITDTTLKSRWIEGGQKLPVIKDSIKEVASLATELDDISTTKYNCYPIKRYSDATSTTVVKDYGVDLYLLNGIKETKTKTKTGITTTTEKVNKYDDCDEKHKHFFRWLCSKLPAVFDRIEQATGLKPGAPYIDKNKGARRSIYWDATQGSFTDGDTTTGKQPLARILHMEANDEADFNEDTYASLTSPHYNLVNIKNDTIKSRDIKSLANNGGVTNDYRTKGDTLEHEMLHFTHAMNFIQETTICPEWFKEGFAELIRGRTFTAYKNNSSIHTYGEWGILFFEKEVTVEDTPYTLGFENILKRSEVTIPDKYRGLKYAAGWAFWKFLIKSIGRGWDGQFTNLVKWNDDKTQLSNVPQYDSKNLDLNNSYSRSLQCMRTNPLTREEVSKEEPWNFMRNFRQFLMHYRHCHCTMDSKNSIVNLYDIYKSSPKWKLENYNITCANSLTLLNAACNFASGGKYTTIRKAVNEIIKLMGTKKPTTATKANSFLKDNCGILIGDNKRGSMYGNVCSSTVDISNLTKAKIKEEIIGVCEFDSMISYKNIKKSDKTILVKDTTNTYYWGPHKVWRLDDETKSEDTCFYLYFCPYVTKERNSYVKKRDYYALEQTILRSIVDRYFPLLLQKHYDYNALSLESEFSTRVRAKYEDGYKQSRTIRIYFYESSSGAGATTHSDSNKVMTSPLYNKNGIKISHGYRDNQWISFYTGQYLKNGLSNENNKDPKTNSSDADVNHVKIYIDLMHEMGHWFALIQKYDDGGTGFSNRWYSESFADWITSNEEDDHAGYQNCITKGPANFLSEFDNETTTDRYRIGVIFLKYILTKMLK